MTHKRKMLAMLLAVVLAAGQLPGTAWASDSDFVVGDGVLTKYSGPGRDVTIPDGVTSIGKSAFADSSLTDVYYGGSESQWKEISFGEGNELPAGAVIHCNN